MPFITNATTKTEVTITIQRDLADPWPWVTEGSLTVEPFECVIVIAVSMEADGTHFRVRSTTVSKGARILKNGTRSDVPLRRGGMHYYSRTSEGTKFVNGLRQMAIDEAVRWWNKVSSADVANIHD